MHGSNSAAGSLAYASAAAKRSKFYSESRIGYKLSTSPEPPKSIQYRRPHMELARRILSEAHRTFWLLEVTITDVQKMYGFGLLKRSKDNQTWIYDVPTTPPPPDLVTMLHYDVKVVLHLGQMEPVALEKSWRFFMFSDPATASAAMDLAIENAFLKKKGNVESVGSLFVADVKALVLLGFISSRGAKMESLGGLLPLPSQI